MSDSSQTTPPSGSATPASGSTTAPDQPTAPPAPTDHNSARTYVVTHTTTYSYDEAVTESYGRALFTPRATSSQNILASDVDCTPEPHVLTQHTDLWGNHSHYLEVRTPHTTLEVTKSARIRVHWPAPDLDKLNTLTVAQAAAAIAESADPVERTTYLLPSTLVELSEEVLAYARTYLPETRPFGDALAALYEGIYTDFAYTKGATTVSTTLPELLASREGVCQDFAHLAVGCLRTVGIPARYVSGYIETMPPPGQVKLAGSDATHAWVAAMSPFTDERTGEREWVDLDPTNNHFADSRYLITGWGRDYRDVAPLRGVIFTEGKKSTLKVAVDVIRQEEE